MWIRGRLCETGGAVEIAVEAGRIVEVAPWAAEFGGAPAHDGLEAMGDREVWIAPGFLDLQLNGYGGEGFTGGVWGTAEAVDAIGRIVGRAARAGTALLCPTVCTAAAGEMEAGLTRIAAACDGDRELASAIPAIHVEGPYLADEDGPRGAHPKEHVRDPDWAEFERFQEAAGGRIGLWTLAPEREGALRFIERASEAGVTVAIGHTAASPERIGDAVRAGARMSTHLGNGAHAQLARHPNYIWEQLACDELTASVIADGHHLPAEVVKSIARVKGPDRLCLVSDAVALGGCAPGLYADGRHEVLPTGKVVLAGTPYLAGAGHLQDRCVANALRFTDLGLAGVARAAATTPARMLGLEGRKGKIARGWDADLTLFRLPAGEAPLRIVATVRAGRVVYRS